MSCLTKCKICGIEVINNSICTDCKDIIVNNYLIGKYKSPEVIKHKVIQKRIEENKNNVKDFIVKY